MFCFLNSRKGSILLEIAIGIAILAVISGAMIRKIIITKKSMNEQVTKANIDTVVIALASFVASNRRLPRPALDENGVESVQNCSIGFVPYKTLGLSERIAKDGRLNFLVYIVEPSLTNSSRIYENDIENNSFCNSVVMPYIKFNSNLSSDIIAFVIDIKEHKNIIHEQYIKIQPSEYTIWITRNVLLMKYLKNSPCERENPNNVTNQTFFNNF